MPVLIILLKAALETDHKLFHNFMVPPKVYNKRELSKKVSTCHDKKDTVSNKHDNKNFQAC